MQNLHEIDHQIIGAKFSDYESLGFHKIDRNDDLSHWFNYRLVSNDIRFFDYPIKSINILVENGIILKTQIVLEILEIDYFFNRIDKKYGRLNTWGISSKYLNKHGFTIDVLQNPDVINVFKNNLPIPELMDYKDLDRVSWHRLKSSNIDRKVSMVIRNGLLYNILGQDNYEVEVKYFLSEY